MIRVGRMQALSEIGRLQDTLRRLGQVPRKVAIIAAPKLSRLLTRQFRDGQDPYGKPWRPLRPSTLRKHGPPPLTASGRMARGTLAKAEGANRKGVRVLVGAPYGYFHQVGFRAHKTRVAARRILPQYGIPSAWRKVLDESMRQAARDAVKAGGHK
jgi:hypothetical protein